MNNQQEYNLNFGMPQYHLWNLFTGDFMGPPLYLNDANDIFTAFPSTFDFTNPLLDFAPNLLAPCMEEATPTTPCMVINEQLQIPPLPLPSLDFSFLSTKKAPKKITKRKPWPRRRRSSVQRTVKAIDYNDITVLELKDLLKEVGTKVSGKKEALIHRLKSEFDL